ncbi:MAG: hypothetical protein RR273_03795 [Oscillospiraceae bacterium]
MKNKILPILYAAYLALYFIMGFVGFGVANVAIKEEVTLPIAEVRWINLKQMQETVFISATNDPQLIISIDPEVQKVKTVKYKPLQGGTGTKILYYQTGTQKEFSEKRCVLPQIKKDGTVQYILPRGNITKLRLDIGEKAGETIEIEGVTVNFKPKLSDYFLITPMDIGKFLVLPLLVGAILRYIIELYEFYVKKQR